MTLDVKEKNLLSKGTRNSSIRKSFNVLKKITEVSPEPFLSNEDMTADIKKY